jgi:hypothetical protein
MRHCLIFISLFYSSISRSQNTNLLSVGLDLAIPSGTISNSNLGFGGSLQYQLKFSAPIAIQLNADYLLFGNKSYSGEKLHFFPVRLGLAGFLYRDILFVAVDGGISHFHSTASGSNLIGYTVNGGIGYMYTIGNNQFMQMNLYYAVNHFKSKTSNSNLRYNWFTIRASYGLSFGKRRMIKV